MTVHALFFLSGLAALVYQVVWTRWLILVFGATVHSASTVLAAFMAGSALGAAWGARLCRGGHKPLALYGRLELGIAACALLFPAGARLLLLVVETTDLPADPVRFVGAFLLLLAPAALMGATFPVLSQHAVRGEPGRGVGQLYAANLLGAAAGTLPGAFVLIPMAGLWGAHLAAAGLNAAVGLTALRLSRGPRSRAAPAARGAAGAAGSENGLPAEPDRGAEVFAVAAVFLSGLGGMAAEVVWARLLVPMFNNSVYGFASVVFVYLVGLGIGSLAASRLKGGDRGLPGALLAASAVLGLLGYQALELTHLLFVRFAGQPPSIVTPPVLAPLTEVLASLTPHAVAQGMMLPVALRQLGPRGGVGPAVGRLYFWNTAGAILGALAAGFWWLPAYNAQNSLYLLVAIGIAGGSALAVLASRDARLKVAVPAGALILAGLGWAPLRGRHLPTQLLMDWNMRHPEVGIELLHHEEDIEASVAVFRVGGVPNLTINGTGVTLYTNATKMMAHIPLLLHPAPERTLVICFGMGTTFRSAMRHGGRVDVVDLVRGVFNVFPFFYADARRWAFDPRARIIVEDGRNHLLRDREGYDVITVDPSPPIYAAGTVNLYSRDFFKLARRRLKPGGILAVWIPPVPEADFKMILKGFVDVMPHAGIWLGSRTIDGVVAVGSGAPIVVDKARIRRRLRGPEVRGDLLELNREFAREDSFWKLYLGPAGRFRDYLSGSPAVTDAFPWIEYPYFRSRIPGYAVLSPVFRWPPVPVPETAS